MSFLAGVVGRCPSFLRDEMMSEVRSYKPFPFVPDAWALNPGATITDADFDAGVLDGPRLYSGGLGYQGCVMALELVKTHHIPEAKAGLIADTRRFLADYGVAFVVPVFNYDAVFLGWFDAALYEEATEMVAYRDTGSPQNYMAASADNLVADSNICKLLERVLRGDPLQVDVDPFS
jgi:hypothetical protein